MRPHRVSSILIVTLVMSTACIPARVGVRPAVGGVVRDGERPAAGMTLLISETRGDSSCSRVAARATTDSSGAFAFPRRRAWRALPLLGIADAWHTWHVCGDDPVAPAYTRAVFGGPAAPARDSISCALGVTAAGARTLGCEHVGGETERRE